MNKRSPQWTAKQQRLLEQLAEQIPHLIKNAGKYDAHDTIMIVGHKRRPDGKLVEVTLHAKVLQEPAHLGAGYNELPPED